MRLRVQSFLEWIFISSITLVSRKSVYAVLRNVRISLIYRYKCNNIISNDITIICNLGIIAIFYLSEDIINKWFFQYQEILDFIYLFLIVKILKYLQFYIPLFYFCISNIGIWKSSILLLLLLNLFYY